MHRSRLAIHKLSYHIVKLVWNSAVSLSGESSLLSLLNELVYDLILEVEAVDDRLDGVTCRRVYHMN